MLSAEYRVHPIDLNCQPCWWLGKLYGCCYCRSNAKKEAADSALLLSDVNIHDYDGQNEEDGDTETQQISLDFVQPLSAPKDAILVASHPYNTNYSVPQTDQPSLASLLSTTTISTTSPTTLVIPSLNPTSPMAGPIAVTIGGCDVKATVDGAAPAQPTNRGSWRLLPSEPQEETVTVELDFTSLVPQIDQTNYSYNTSEVDQIDDNTQDFSFQVDLDNDGREVIQHFVLTESGLVEQ